MFEKKHASVGARSSVFWLAILVLLLLQTWIFATGYRMTADDMVFQNALLESMDTALQITHHNATLQGRIGQYVSVPLVILGSYWADPLWVRVVYAGLYFLVGGFVALYIARLLKAKATLFLCVLMLCLLNIGPLRWNHLPPTAYPLLISVPMFLIIIAKLWKQRCITHMAHFGAAKKSLYGVVMLVAMSMNEFALLFGSGLLLLDYAAARITPAGQPQATNPPWWNLRPYLVDISAIVLALAMYIAFRLNFPSQYDGNMPNGLHNVSAVLHTLSAHILASTAAPVWLDPNSKLLALTTSTQWLLAALFGVLSGGLIFALLKPAIVNLRAWPVIAGLLLFTTYVTLPTALTQKYQDWCTRGVCVYIDSRISYFGLMAALGLCLLLAASILGRTRIATAYRLVVAFMVAGLSAYTFLNNQLIRVGMQDYTQAWERAQHYICRADADPVNDPNLLQTIDPHGLVVFHPNYPKQSYWINYMHHYRAQHGCTTRAP